MSHENTTADALFVLGVGEANLDLEKSKTSLVAADSDRIAGADHSNEPTEEERRTLRRVAGSLPIVAYIICAVEFAERASYYGVQPLIGNFVNRPLPSGGNGYGAPPRNTQQTAGALGLGTVKSTAVSQSFSMLAYTLPMIFGYLSDTKTGRLKMICYGVAVCGVSHVLMIASGSKSLLASGNAKIPYFISLYILSLGAAMFKPCVSPMLLDQMKNPTLQLKTLESGEKVIVDPEATTERAMLWFYLLINVGGFMGVPTSYSEKYVGWWLAFLLPLILYLPLGPLLWWLRKRLVLHPPGGSDLGNVMRILGICFQRGGFKRIFTGGFFEVAKPTNLALLEPPITVPWNDAFVDDVKRAFQATGIFCFFPIQSINDNGLGGAQSALSTMLTTNGVPNDVINNINSLAIIIGAPILNYGLYPFLRRKNIHFGPIARITFGLFLSSVAGLGYTLLTHYAYKLGPCGSYGSSPTCVDANGISLVSPITIWWTALPVGLGGISELFVNVPAFGIAYAMAPKNMRSLVSALNLLSAAFAYAFGLAFSSLIRDPYLTWDFGAPTIVGFVATGVFWWVFRGLDKQEFQLSRNGDYHQRVEGEGDGEGNAVVEVEGERERERETRSQSGSVSSVRGEKMREMEMSKAELLKRDEKVLSARRSIMFVKEDFKI